MFLEFLSEYFVRAKNSTCQPEAAMFNLSSILLLQIVFDCIFSHQHLLTLVLLELG